MSCSIFVCFTVFFPVLCQILSLQADEVHKESQVEEYERELARARWRLRKLREEVKHAKKKVEEAGERNVPLQDSIRQSYEEILQVCVHMLYMCWVFLSLIKWA